MEKSILLFFMVGLFTLTSCSDNKSESGNETVPVQFYLTDAPTLKEYRYVNIDVQSVSYSLSGDSWNDLPITPSLVELLQFSNGKDTLLSDITLESGVKIQQIRLLLGENNSLVLNDGTIAPLKVPSGQTSGLKINVQSVPELTSGYKVIIDFDAARSIIAKGNGSYSLKPVIRAYIEANTSSVYGNLLPANEMTRVFTLNAAGDTISTVSDTLQNNYFKLHGLFSGTYAIQVQNLNTGDFATLKENVIVTKGSDINLNTLTIPTY